jgi:hypothetical protein
MFMDESRFEDQDETYTCVTGLVVPASKAVRISKKVNRSVRKYIGREYSLLDGTINLKPLRQTKHIESPFSDLTKEQRYRLTREIYNILDSAGCTLVCSIIQERENYSEAMKKGIYFILERFFYFLNEHDSSGIVISDQPVSERKDYMEEIVKLVRSEEYWEQKFQERIYQNIFFTRDDWDPIIQITDHVAYCLSAYVRNCLKTISLQRLSERYDFRYKLRKNPFFKMILPLIRTGPNELISGRGIKCW